MIAIPYYETSNFVFSNLSAHAVEYSGVRYPTVEHAYHAQKFNDESLRRRIQSCNSPSIAWELAREFKAQRRPDWEDIKVSILSDIMRAKVEQNPDVRKALLATGNQEIVEINPNDDFWGSGADGTGQNHAGKILMRIRDEIAKNSAVIQQI